MDETEYVLFGGLGDTLSAPEVRPVLSAAIAACQLPPRPHVLILATASGDAPAHLARAADAFGRLGCPTTNLTVFQYRDPEWLEKIEQADMIWVCGGSTLSLLALWRANGIAQALLERHQRRPLVFMGTSAGMNCWFDQSVTWSSGTYAPILDGLGWIHGSACPHADSQPDRYAVYTQAVADGTMLGGIAVGETTAIKIQVDAQKRVCQHTVFAVDKPMYQFVQTP